MKTIETKMYLERVVHNFIFNIWWVWMLLGVSLLIGLPSLNLWWDFADDSLILETSHQISHALKAGNWQWFIQILAEPGSGRMRAGYWFFHWLLFEGFGTNPFFHRLVYLFLMVGTTLGVAVITRRISSSSVAAFLAGIFFVTATPNVWTWYRMGFLEAPFTFSITFALLFLIESLLLWEKNKILAKVFLILALLFSAFIYPLKETGIVFSGVAIALLILFKFSKEGKGNNLKFPLTIFVLVNILIAFFNWLFFFKFGSRGGYYQTYFTTKAFWQHVTENFFGYKGSVDNIFSPFWPVLILTFGVTFLFLLLKKSLSWYWVWNLAMLFLFLGVWVIYEPLGYRWTVYFSPAFVGLSIFSACEINRLFCWSGRKIKFTQRYFKKFFLLMILIGGLIFNFFPIKFSISFDTQPLRLIFFIFAIFILFRYFFKLQLAQVFRLSKRLSIKILNFKKELDPALLAPVIVIGIAVITFLQILHNGYQLNHFVADYLAREKSNSQVLNWLSSNIQPGSLVAVNLIPADIGFEYYNGFDRYFKFLLERQDVKFVYLDLEKWETYKKVDYIVSPVWDPIYTFSLSGTITSAWEKIARYETKKIESTLSIREFAAIHVKEKAPHPLVLTSSYPLHLVRMLGAGIFKNQPLTYDRLLPKFEYYYSWKIYKII